MASTTLAPTVTALSLLSMDPSPAVVHSARNAAGTRHGLVNVTRLVRSLDKQRLEHVRHEADGSNWLEVQKTWEVGALSRRRILTYLDCTVRSGVALCPARRQRTVSRVRWRCADFGRASTTAPALGDLDATLSKIEVHVQATAKVSYASR